MVDYDLVDEILYRVLSRYTVADIIRSMREGEIVVKQWNVQPVKPLLSLWGTELLKNVTTEGVLTFIKNKRPDLYQILSTYEGRRWLSRNIAYLINDMLLV